MSVKVIVYRDAYTNVLMSESVMLGLLPDDAIFTVVCSDRHKAYRCPDDVPEIGYNEAKQFDYLLTGNDVNACIFPIRSDCEWEVIMRKHYCGRDWRKWECVVDDDAYLNV